jgi:hypothetical protein
MVNPAAVAVVLVLLAAALAGMAWAWRRRAAAQRGLALPPVPADLGTTRLTASGLHVATTFAGRPLDRVVAGGLGFRARAVLTVTDRGVLVDLAGGTRFLLSTPTDAGTAIWALDRGVERDGLTVLAWTLPDADGAAVPVESAFRFDPDTQAALLAAIQPRLKEAPHADH